MTWRTILAIAVFVGVCGFIAYWGDLLGRRLGKRRLSLFGMRPRYTAIVTTTITGMIIAVLTIGFMMAASEQARTLIIQGERLIRQNKEYRREYIAAREAASKAARELARQQKLADEARRKAETALEQRDKLAADIARLTKSLKALEADLASSRAELSQTKTDLANSRKQLRQAEADLASARAELTQRLAEIELRKKALAELNIQAERIWGSLAEKGKQYAAMRQRMVIFRSNEEIARKVVNCSDSKFRIRADVLELLDTGNQRALAEGAKVGENGRAVAIYPKEIVDPNTGQKRFTADAESIDAVVDEISEGIGTVVVRLVSVDNAIEGEQTWADFVLNYNRLVYAPGDEVARTVVDGSASRGEILGQLIGFLKGEVRSAAVGRGVIPSYDEEGQMSVVEIPGQQLLETVDQIKAVAAPVEVRAAAKTQIWSGDPVTLNFLIGESP